MNACWMAAFKAELRWIGLREQNSNKETIIKFELRDLLGNKTESTAILTAGGWKMRGQSTTEAPHDQDSDKPRSTTYKWKARRL